MSGHFFLLTVSAKSRGNVKKTPIRTRYGETLEYKQT